MRSILAGLLVLGLTMVSRADDQTEPKAIIDKAIKAHGGEEKLAKLYKMNAVHSKAKGTLHLLGGIELTVETMVQDPDKLKIITKAEVMGKNVTTIQVFNGDKFWINVNGQTLENILDDKMLAEAKEQLYQEKMTSLAFLKDKSVELSPLGELPVNGKPALGIRISSKGHRDVSMYFDKVSGLAVKVEARVLDFQSKQEVTQEKIVSDYKEVDGYLRPTKVVINQDGKKFMDLEILEVKFFDKLGESEFAKP